MRIFLSPFLITLMLSLLLAGCGFHLRGKDEGRLYRKLPIVQLSPYLPLVPLYKETALSLSGAGVKVFTPHDKRSLSLPLPSLHIVDKGIMEQTLAYGPNGQVHRERLVHEIHYQLLREDQTLRAERTIKTQRDRQLNPNQSLADNDERNLIEKEMRADLIAQLMRQLSLLE